MSRCKRCGYDEQETMQLAKRENFAPIFIQALSDTTKNTILALYPEQDFLRREFLKMNQWLSENGHKTPRSAKGWSRFVMGWLNRGWDQYRKTLTSNAPQTMKWDEVFQ